MQVLQPCAGIMLWEGETTTGMQLWGPCKRGPETYGARGNDQVGNPPAYGTPDGGKIDDDTGPFTGKPALADGGWG